MAEPEIVTPPNLPAYGETHVPNRSFVEVVGTDKDDADRTVRFPWAVLAADAAGQGVAEITLSTYEFSTGDTGRYLRATNTSAKNWTVSANVGSEFFTCWVFNEAVSGALTISGVAVSVNGAFEGSVSLEPGETAIVRRETAFSFRVQKLANYVAGTTVNSINGRAGEVTLTAQDAPTEQLLITGTTHTLDLEQDKRKILWLTATGEKTLTLPGGIVDEEGDYYVYNGAALVNDGSNDVVLSAGSLSIAAPFGGSTRIRPGELVRILRLDNSSLAMFALVESPQRDRIGTTFKYFRHSDDTSPPQIRAVKARGTQVARATTVVGDFAAAFSAYVFHKLSSLPQAIELEIGGLEFELAAETASAVEGRVRLVVRKDSADVVLLDGTGDGVVRAPGLFAPGTNATPYENLEFSGTLSGSGGATIAHGLSSGARIVTVAGRVFNGTSYEQISWTGAGGPGTRNVTWNDTNISLTGFPVNRPYLLWAFVVP